jgi:UDP-N-acetylenolpyruvoylglucosamine reductase
VQGGTTASVLEAAKGDARFSFVEDFAALSEKFSTAFKDLKVPKDLTPAPATLVFIGAGDIGNMAFAFARALRRRETCTPDFSLGARTTFATGGRCAWFAEPESLPELRQLLRDAQDDRLPVLVIGRGSNLLVSDNGFSGLALQLSHPVWREIRVDAPARRVFCGAGALLHQIARAAANAGFDGFPFLHGIPGTLGGALRMNAGAMGASIFERVENITWLDASGALHERQPATTFGAVYRDCAALRGGVVLGAELLATGTIAPEAALELMRADAVRRRATQPAEPSAGSVFKNPPGDSAGRLIDSLGLKGLRIGGAAVSEVHANFIVNRDDASATDIAALVRRVRAAVHEATGVLLEPEIQLVGEAW